MRNPHPGQNNKRRKHGLNLQTSKFKTGTLRYAFGKNTWRNTFCRLFRIHIRPLHTLSKLLTVTITPRRQPAFRVGRKRQAWSAHRILSKQFSFSYYHMHQIHASLTQKWFGTFVCMQLPQQVGFPNQPRATPSTRLGACRQVKKN